MKWGNMTMDMHILINASGNQVAITEPHSSQSMFTLFFFYNLRSFPIIS